MFERTLIQNCALLLPDRVAPRGWLLIDGARIADLGEGDPPPELSAAQRLLADGQALLPGFTNAHTHLEQTFMRGFASGRPLLEWLRNYIWKLQAAMDEGDVRLAVTLGMVEALRGGATHIVQHHKVGYARETLALAEQFGVRLTLARAWADVGTEAEPAARILAELRDLFAEWHGKGNGRIRIANGPLAPWRCSADTLRRSVSLARQYGAFTHCHMNETQREVALTLQQHHLRPIEWFDALGILEEDFQAVHCVWLSDGEAKRLIESRATVVHCPAANMILASGCAPIARLRRNGARIALATDGPASNDGQDMFEMMHLATLLQRVHTLDPQALSPRDALQMAWGTHALRVGAPADLVLVRVGSARIQPVHDWHSALVHNIRQCDVATVIVDGRMLIREGCVQFLDEAALLEECRARARHLARRAGLS